MSEFEDFFEEIRKAIVVMPKRPPIIVKEGKVVGIKLNSATIEELSKPNYVKPIAENDINYINYLMGVKIYRDDTVSKPIYIVEGEIETELKTKGNAKPSEALEEVNEMINSLEEYNKLMRFRKPPETATDIMLRKLNIVKQTLIKAQEQEEENGRAFGKDIINLNKTLRQVIDKPILYASRYGNKYIVPQELFEKQNKVLEIIKKKRVDVYCLLQCKTVEEYNDECFCKDDLLTKDEFYLLKEVLSYEHKTED